jgi:dihydrofolate reductase
MRKLILQEWISLDGHVADKHGQLDFFTALSNDANKYSDHDQLKFMDDIDTILLGRITYHLFVEFWPTATTDMEVIADKLNMTRKLIFSNSLKKAPWGKWPEAEIVRGQASNEIRKLKTEEGKNMVLWGSISLAQSLIKENLIDEYHLQLCPTITGGGRPLFAEGNYMNMNLIELRKYETGMIFLRYQPKTSA